MEMYISINLVCTIYDRHYSFVPNSVVTEYGRYLFPLIKFDHQNYYYRHLKFCMNIYSRVSLLVKIKLEHILG